MSYLGVEKWVGNRNEGELIENPDWIQIESAIRQLDGKSKTLVTLGAEELEIITQSESKTITVKPQNRRRQ